MKKPHAPFDWNDDQIARLTAGALIDFHSIGNDRLPYRAIVFVAPYADAAVRGGRRIDFVLADD